MYRVLLSALVVLTIAPTPARAQEPPAPAGAQEEIPQHIVVLDLTSSARKDRQVIAIPYSPASLAELRGITSEALRDAALEKLEDADAGTRWTSRRGHRLVAVVLHDPGTTARIRFDEQARDTRLGADLVTLAQLALRVGVGAEGVAPAIIRTEAVYILRKPRAKLLVAASVARTPAPVPAAPAAAAAAATPAPEKNEAEVTLVTGPTEHLFLSANAGAASASALKYDDDSNSLQPRETPTGFFIGINYTFGDILSDPAKANGDPFANFFSGMYVGGTLQGSRRPFDQAGVHVGFRNNPLPFLNEVVSFETVSPYVGIVWTKNDRVDDAGNLLGERRYGRGEFVWGVSLNLDKALGWVGDGGK